jgi:hypothetical protein
MRISLTTALIFLLVLSNAFFVFAFYNQKIKAERASELLYPLQLKPSYAQLSKTASFSNDKEPKIASAKQCQDIQDALNKCDSTKTVLQSQVLAILEQASKAADDARNESRRMHEELKMMKNELDKCRNKN